MKYLVHATVGAAVLGLVLFSLPDAAGHTGAEAATSARSLLLTQVPTGASASCGAGATLDERYPEGSRVVLASAEAPDELLVLSRGLIAAGAPDLSPSADRVVFVGRERAGERWRVWEAPLDGGAPRVIAAAHGDCADPAYLSPGRVAFVVHPADEPSLSYLAVADEDGAVQRITFGAGAVATPTGLVDGRILFAMATAGEKAGLALFTVNADGTMLEPFTDLHEAAHSELRPRVTRGGGVVLLANASDAVTVERVEMAHPASGRTRLLVDSGTGSPTSVEPVASGGIVLCDGAGVSLFEPGEAAPRVLLDAPEWEERDALLVEPSPRPRKRPSAVNPALETAFLICYDAGLTDARVGPPAEAAPPTSIVLEALADGLPLELGSAPLEADRSVHLEVPADTALRVRTLDRERRELATSGWFWLRPGEVRTCFGCHEPRDTAPANRPVRAVATEPRWLAEMERSPAR